MLLVYYHFAPRGPYGFVICRTSLREIIIICLALHDSYCLFFFSVFWFIRCRDCGWREWATSSQEKEVLPFQKQNKKSLTLQNSFTSTQSIIFVLLFKSDLFLTTWTEWDSLHVFIAAYLLSWNEINIDLCSRFSILFIVSWILSLQGLACCQGCFRIEKKISKFLGGHLYSWSVGCDTEYAVVPLWVIFIHCWH